MAHSTILRSLIVGVIFVLLAGARVDQGSPLEAGLPSPHNRVGIYLTSYALTKPECLKEIFEAAREGKLNAVVINVKNMHGEVTYKSTVSLAKEIGASTGRLDLCSLLPVLREKGIYLIARQVLFYDPKLATYLSQQGPWVYPSDERAIAYNLEIAQEVVALGFDEIQFDYIRFPDGGELIPIYEERYAAVNRFLEKAGKLLSGHVVISVDIFGRIMWNWNKKRIDPIGQSLEEMAPYVDLVSPMLYPSHYREQHYKDDPYRVVTEALTTGKARVTTPFRPFLQAFDQAIPPEMSLEDYIRAQVRAAKEAGADGYLFWHPACDYASLYRALD